MSQCRNGQLKIAPSKHGEIKQNTDFFQGFLTPTDANSSTYHLNFSI